MTIPASIHNFQDLARWLIDTRHEGQPYGMAKTLKVSAGLPYPAARPPGPAVFPRAARHVPRTEEEEVMRYALLLLFLAGCTTTIRMMHPDGREATCGPYFTEGALGHQAAERERRCLDDYEQQGFRRR